METLFKLLKENAGSTTTLVNEGVIELPTLDTFPINNPAR